MHAGNTTLPAVNKSYRLLRFSKVCLCSVSQPAQRGMETKAPSFIYSFLAISHVPTTVHYLLLDSDNERTLPIIKQNNYPLLKQTNTNNLIKHPLISGSSKELIYKSNLDPRCDLVVRQQWKSQGKSSKVEREVV